MSIFHMYTGDDGQSHIEEPALSAQPSQETPQATQEIFFRELPAGTAMDWHNAPRRQYVIVLKGQMEIGFKDGSVQHCGAGDAVLAADLTGSGHTTRVVGDGPAVVGVVPVAD